ncbi:MULTISPECIES: alpha/beta hydrolase [Streptomycetaceae]|uniref:Secreted protein n=1 Tax=Streptantibioticus cattleyicolor (strain ATCC 35852 / DSM 46488 / JCM 4925 / NBRC 14057 / NRRL 8057) TaxID=1003195 RepID=F8K475_STREN|nr:MULTISPECIES: alpha/beta hydrolase family protein [Streptomycetaceae]AEW92623.1 secreted protein [Streptantibioticus cattleyicolor NRRL 8057 = DSM 46488]MYS57402.1 esterase family protein [Streptomyces sp. SID5468]CCB72976.1 putative secreted protein [Streptantibioticus cattleyicolor NRRL 8057 = DSM 46488]
MPRDPEAPPGPLPRLPVRRLEALMRGRRPSGPGVRGPASRRVRTTAGAVPLALSVLAALLTLLMSGAPAARAAEPTHRRAEVVAEHRVGPREVDLDVASPALAATVPVRLLTPDGWRSGAHRHWPTLWLLHGCCGDYTSWTAYTDVASLPELRRVLVVMPEAGRTGFYSDWWNHGAGGAPGWETFHLRELRPLLERSYGAGSDRAVAGLSMGGFGALSYAGRHPGMFRAAASFSGVADPLLAPDGPRNLLDIVRGQDADPYALWGDPVAQRHLWAAHDPYDLAGALRRIPVFLSCGDGTAGPLDPPGAATPDEKLYLAESRHLADRLRQLGDRRLVTDFYGAGTHRWPYWQRELHRALPVLLRALRVPVPPEPGVTPG